MLKKKQEKIKCIANDCTVVVGLCETTCIGPTLRKQIANFDQLKYSNTQNFQEIKLNKWFNSLT